MLLNHALKVLLGSVFLSQSVYAAELLSVGLRVSVKYETFGEACHLGDLFRHYDLSLEMKERQVSRARLTKINIVKPDRIIEIQQADLPSFDVRTEQNLSWIKSFSVSPEVMRTLINTAEGLGRSDSCKPHGDLIFDHVESTHFDFGVEEVGHLLPTFIYSKPVIFNGYRSNGDPFRIEMTLTQDRT